MAVSHHDATHYEAKIKHHGCGRNSSGCGYLEATFYDKNGRRIAEHWW